MKVFLVIMGFLLATTFLEFILKVIGNFQNKRILEQEIQSLQARLMTAENLAESYLKTISNMVEISNKYEPRNKVSQDTIDAVFYAMKKAHPDNGGKEEDFIRFKKCYEELTRGDGNA